jgi:hypothetical protein
VGPTYSMVDFKKKLLDLYKSCTEVINVSYLNTDNVVIVLLEFWLIAEKTKKKRGRGNWLMNLMLRVFLICEIMETQFIFVK